MNNTINVSIAGIAFILENEGYRLLKDYLVRIEVGYKGNPDGPEILSDIEARISELILNEQDADTVVTAERIRTIIGQLGLPDGMVYRQPFPGPGLGVRCLGAITRDRLEAVRESDAILREEFQKAGLAGKVWQYFTIVPDLKSVGVRDGKRTDAWPVILRAVNTVDAMTATVEDVPFALLQKITDRITHEVDGVNRVLYDLTPKPTGTIEWE